MPALQTRDGLSKTLLHPDYQSKVAGKPGLGVIKLVSLFNKQAASLPFTKALPENSQVLSSDCLLQPINRCLQQINDRLLCNDGLLPSTNDSLQGINQVLRRKNGEG